MAGCLFSKDFSDCNESSFKGICCVVLSTTSLLIFVLTRDYLKQNLPVIYLFLSYLDNPLVSRRVIDLFMYFYMLSGTIVRWNDDNIFCNE